MRVLQVAVRKSAGWWPFRWSFFFVPSLILGGRPRMSALASTLPWLFLVPFIGPCGGCYGPVTVQRWFFCSSPFLVTIWLKWRSVVGDMCDLSLCHPVGRDGHVFLTGCQTGPAPPPSPFHVINWSVWLLFQCALLHINIEVVNWRFSYLASVTGSLTHPMISWLYSSSVALST